MEWLFSVLSHRYGIHVTCDIYFQISPSSLLDSITTVKHALGNWKKNLSKEDSQAFNAPTGEMMARDRDSVLEFLLFWELLICSTI